jgi:ribonuclease D
MSVTVVEGDLPSGLACTLRRAGSVAVDTETSGLEWSTDRLLLCQLYTAESGPVLLRRVGGRPEQLATVLGDPAVLKIFHFAPFDLRFLEAQWQVKVETVACTKAASRLLEPQLPAQEHTLRSLLQRYLGVMVTKGPVRTSDWGASVLSDEQIAYAAADVAHLLDLHAVLMSHLNIRGLSKLYSQVCTYLPVDAHLAVSGIPDPLAY